MKVEIIPSPGGRDIMLKITASPLVAIEKWQEEQPAKNLREGRGHE